NEDGVRHLEGVMCELEEWQLLAEVTPDALEAAELYAAIGHFSSAAKRLRPKLETDPRNREVLCRYYLK
ncbi:unnamed protein product, partial [Ostreobium quekettii]